MGNCPLPVFNGNVTDIDISGVTVIYNVTYSSSNSTGSLFQCSYITQSNDVLLGVSEVTKEYGATAFGFIPIGWLGYIADSITQIGQKIQAYVTTAWLFVNAPAEVTNLDFFTYIQVFLLSLMGFGTYLAFRSGA